jgi:hypothetical protein
MKEIARMPEQPESRNEWKAGTSGMAGLEHLGLPECLPHQYTEGTLPIAPIGEEK